MSKSLLTKKLSFLLAWALVFSVLFTAIVYACSGVNFMQMASVHTSMDGETTSMPCEETKQDICQYVRQLMLSVQASSTQVEAPRQNLILPWALPRDVLMPTEILPSLPQLAIAFHPLFKIPLTYSYLVLRI